MPLSLLVSSVLTGTIFLWGDVTPSGKGFLLGLHANASVASSWTFDPRKVEFRVARSNPRLSVKVGFANPGSLKAIKADPKGRLDWKAPLILTRRADESGWIRFDVVFRRSVLHPGKRQVAERGTTGYEFYQPNLSSNRLGELSSLLKGKRVWLFGSVAIQREWIGTDRWSPSLSARVVRVESTSKEWASCSTAGGSLETQFYRPQDFQTSQPMRIWLETPQASLGYIEIADAWMIPYVLSFQSPEKPLTSESNDNSSKFEKGGVEVGMSKELVVRTLGYPNFRRPISEMWASRRWVYSGSAPFSLAIQFDSHNRVRDLKYSGDLP